jgi:GDP-4-dehydro-6-deoxy-D-mannose reductase
VKHPNVLVTGIGGFAGAYLAPKLIDAGYSVFGIDRTVGSCATLVASNQIKFYESNLNDAAKLGQILISSPIDAVVHMAAVRHADTLSDLTECNVGSLTRLLDAIRLSGREIRLLLVSSSAVYGDPGNRDPILETAKLAPLTPYGATKAAADLLALQWGADSGRHVAIARPFNLIGPGQGPNFFCAKLISQLVAIERGAKEFTLGNLETYRDFLDVRDFVDAMITLLKHGEAGEIYNICSGRATALSEVMNFALLQLGRPVSVTASQGSKAKQDVSFQLGSAQRLRSLGWQPRISLAQSLADMLDLARKN